MATGFEGSGRGQEPVGPSLDTGSTLGSGGTGPGGHEVLAADRQVWSGRCTWQPKCVNYGVGFAQSRSGPVETGVRINGASPPAPTSLQTSFDGVC